MKSLFELIMISEYYDIPLGVFFVVFPKKNNIISKIKNKLASIAQLVEQLTCNQ